MCVLFTYVSLAAGTVIGTLRHLIHNLYKNENACVVASRVLPPGDLACNPGMRPHWESNQ